MVERLGVLVMAYGTPRSPGDVEAYYTDIRRGSPPPPELLRELEGRYQAIGGRSPLYEITVSQARGLEQRLGIKVYLGQKHAAPFIPDAIGAMHADEVERAAGLVLAPHYSYMSIGDYARRAEKAAAEIGWAGSLTVIESWHEEPGYIDWLAARVSEAAAPLVGDPVVVFSAHSLPQAILQRGDPYPDQLRATARAVAAKLGLKKWTTGWQSAGRTKDPWIGPDIVDVIEAVADDGEQSVVICPCGFVADHLEVLYDVDIQAAAAAARRGLAFARTRSPNDDRGFLDMLAGGVRRALDAPG